MARPQKNTVEYFPFICKEGKGMHYIQETYGNDGYVVWIKILVALSTTNYHYLDLSDKKELMFLSSKCKVAKDKLILIIDDLVDLDEFDEHLWKTYKVIWSDKFMENIADAYKKRINKPITKIDLYAIYEDKVTETPQKVTRNPAACELSDEKEANNPHTIVEESIVDNTIRDNTRVEEIKVEEKILFTENKFSEQKSSTKKSKRKTKTYKDLGIPPPKILIENYEIFRKKNFPDAPSKNWNAKQIKHLKDVAVKIKKSMKEKQGDEVTPENVVKGLQYFYKKFTNLKGFELENFSEPEMINSKYDQIIKKITSGKKSKSANRSAIIEEILKS